MVSEIRLLDSAAISAACALVAQDSLLPLGEIKGIMGDHEVWVYEVEGEIAGLAATKLFSRDLGLRLYVGPTHRGKGVGRALFEHVRPGLADSGRDIVTATYRSDAGESRGFFARRGFRPWFDMVYLAYEGPRMEVSVPAIGGYRDEHFTEYSNVLGCAFLPMRRQHNFVPHDVRELHRRPGAREEVLQASADTFVATASDGRVVAVASIEGDFIDTVGVLPGYQGQGFGRALTAHCVNVLQERGHRVVRTSVLADNVPAKSLYLDMGFRPVVSYEDAALRVR